MKQAQKRKILKTEEKSLSALQVPKSPSPGISLAPLTIDRPPQSPQRILLGIDRGKKASEVSLKSWKPPTWRPPNMTPEKPSRTFAEKLATVSRDTKRKAAITTERDRKKQKTFNPMTSVAIEQDEWCKYTGFNLRTRVIEQSILKEEFRGKTTYSITDLYRLVKPPSYDPPEYDTLDFLVTGIVASKSPVRQIRGRQDGANYLVVKITDLKVKSPVTKN